MYLDAQGNVLPESNKESSIVGYKAVGVPGSVAGLVYAEKKYGKLSIEKVMAPAIRLARDGFALAYEDARDLMEDEYLGEFPESKRIFSARRQVLSARRNIQAARPRPHTRAHFQKSG